MKKNKVILSFILFLAAVCFFYKPVDVFAYSADEKEIVISNSISSYVQIANDDKDSVFKDEIKTCEGLLGDPTKEESMAWLLDKILDYLKIIAPLLVLVLSSIDFAKAIILSDEDNMKKAQKKLINRMLAAVLLFFIPTVVQLLLDIFGITSCNIY